MAFYLYCWAERKYKFLLIYSLHAVQLTLSLLQALQEQVVQLWGNAEQNHPPLQQQDAQHLGYPQPRQTVCSRFCSPPHQHLSHPSAMPVCTPVSALQGNCRDENQQVSSHPSDLAFLNVVFAQH